MIRLENKSKRAIASAALSSPPGVESATGCTTNVHRTRKPAGDERTNAEDRDQHRGVQKKISQTLRVLHSSGTITAPAFISGLKRHVKRGPNISRP